MRRLKLALFLSSVLVLPMACSSSTTPAKDGGAGSGGSTGGSGGTSGTGGAAAGTGGTSAAGTDGGAGTGAAGTTPDGSTDGPTDGPVLTAQETRGQYLVKNVLGCSGCHTPQLAAGGADNSKFLAGVACFAKDSGGGCLNSANLTSDATGLKNLTDQQIKDAFTTGIYPLSGDAGTQYLFAQMPYYQFAFLNSADADAIVAFLRTVAAVPTPTTTAADSGTFATRPTAPQWTTPSLAALPSPPTPDGGTDAGADAAATEGGTDGAATASESNGKYLAALLCSTCHTVNTGTTSPLQIDPTKAFEGGKLTTVTVTVPADGGTDAAADGGSDAGEAGATMSESKQIESANLTPDTTGLAGWTAPQIDTAITTAKDNMGRSICGMRALSGLTASDTMDIANYLQAIPPVMNTIAPTCY
jgi:hypothetical protein